MFSRIYWALGSPLKYCFCRVLPLPSELNKWRVSIRRLIQYQSMTNCSKAGRAETHLHKSWLAVEQQLFWYYIFRLTVPADLNAFFCIALSPSFWTFFSVGRDEMWPNYREAFVQRDQVTRRELQSAVVRCFVPFTEALKERGKCASK